MKTDVKIYVRNCRFVNSKDQKEIIIERMMDRIVHRGPNSSGKFTDDQVALGFRRLSIIDLEGGSQPILTRIEQSHYF